MNTPKHTAPLVTIAIPTYNRAHTYLRPCLESALAQTYSNVEILVSDNGSTDGTQAFVQSYEDVRLRYFRQPKNIPPNDNFNFCLKQARGDYFLLLLDDEQIDLDFVEACMRAADFRAGAGLIRTGIRTIDAKGNVIGEAPNRTQALTLGDFYLSWFANQTAIYLCNTLFNRSALLRVGGFQSRHNLFQDVIAMVKVAAYMSRVDVADVKATTRQHGGQRTHAATVRAWCEDSLDLLDWMCNTAPAQEALIRQRGLRFFARIGYGRANAIRAPLVRLRAYTTVYRTFGYRHMPPLRLLLTGTALYRSLRQVKRRVLHRPAWVD